MTDKRRTKRQLQKRLASIQDTLETVELQVNRFQTLSMKVPAQLLEMRGFLTGWTAGLKFALGHPVPHELMLNPDEFDLSMMGEFNPSEWRYMYPEQFNA